MGSSSASSVLGPKGRKSPVEQDQNHVPFLGRRPSGSQSPVLIWGLGEEKGPILRSQDGALSLLPGQRRHAPLLKNKGCPPTVCTSASWLKSKMAAASMSILPDALLASRIEGSLKCKWGRDQRFVVTPSWEYAPLLAVAVTCRQGPAWFVQLPPPTLEGAAMSTVIALPDLTGRSTLPPETGDLLWLEEAEGACEAGEWE